MRLRHSLPLALAAALLVAVPARACPGTQHVDIKTDEDNGCTPGHCSLREAVANAVCPGDDVDVPKGTYHVTLGQIKTSNGIVIHGAGAGLTTVTAEGKNRIFEFDSAPAASTVRGMTLTGGNGNGDGYAGAILLISGRKLTLDHVRITGNTANRTTTGSFNGDGGGAGIAAATSPLTVLDSTIDHNSSTLHSGHGATNSGGGGIFAFFDVAVTLVRSEVRDNHVEFHPNESTTDSVDHVGGGGLFVTGSPLTLDRSTVARNTFSVGAASGSGAHDSGGGGIYELGFDGHQSMTATNSTIAGNSVDVAALLLDNGGGGLYTIAAPGTLRYLTIARNSAKNGHNNAGGGIYKYDKTVKALGTIVALNSADMKQNCFGSLTSQGHNVENGTSCGLHGTGDKDAAPLLGPLAANGGPTLTTALLRGSPAIDAGASAGCPAVDQRGLGRPSGLACDIGAFEFQFAAPAVTTLRARKVKRRSAKVRGLVNPNGLPTTYRFEYGRTTAYGRSTRLRTAGADFAAQLVSVKVRKLKPGKRYHFRVVATNATGTAAGADRTFRTKRKRKRHRHH